MGSPAGASSRESPLHQPFRVAIEGCTLRHSILAFSAGSDLCIYEKSSAIASDIALFPHYI